MNNIALPAKFSRDLFRVNGMERVDRPLLVQEVVPLRLVRIAATIVAMGVLVVLIWAGIAQVNEVTKANGVLMPNALERQVQHYDGGMVSQVLVREGDLVEKGQPLMRLNDAGTPQDIDVLRKNRDQLRSQIEALEAIRDGRSPQFSGVDDDAALANAATVAAKNASLFAERGQMRSQIAQTQASNAALASEIAGLEKELALATKERERYQALFDRGFATITVLTQKQRAELAVINRIAQLRAQTRVASARVSESQRTLDAFNARNSLEIAQQIRDLKSRLVAIEGELSKKSGQGDRLVVRAPVRGLVKNLAIKSVGEVVTPANPVANIVPVDGGLYAETRVAASQIGHLEIGQPVKLEISAYDFTRYGWIEGTLKSVSPSSFATSEGEHFYTVRVAIDDEALPELNAFSLLPGMEVEADIVTGRKSILQYLLSPVRRGLDNAFTER